MEQIINLSEGDVFYTYHDAKYLIYKLLLIEPATDTYHVLAYSPVDSLPATSEIDDLSIMVCHLPFDKKAFSAIKILANTPIKAKDLIGYHEYLRQTREADYYISIANDYYKTGYNLTSEKKYTDAIDAYSKAIDLFPAFFEAIDNRAFCKMDMGLWVEAIEDFNLSLEQNPNSLLAEFSIGECYFKMGELQKAKQKFEIAEQIDPHHPAPKKFLVKINELLNT